MGVGEVAGNKKENSLATIMLYESMGDVYSNSCILSWFVIRTIGMLVTMIVIYSVKTTNRNMDTRFEWHL